MATAFNSLPEHQLAASRSFLLLSIRLLPIRLPLARMEATQGNPHDSQTQIIKYAVPGFAGTCAKWSAKYRTYSETAVFLHGHGVPIAEATLRRTVSHRRILFSKLDKLIDLERLVSWLQDRAAEPRR